MNKASLFLVLLLALLFFQPLSAQKNEFNHSVELVYLLPPGQDGLDAVRVLARYRFMLKDGDIWLAIDPACRFREPYTYRYKGVNYSSNEDPDIRAIVPYDPVIEFQLHFGSKVKEYQWMFHEGRGLDRLGPNALMLMKAPPDFKLEEAAIFLMRVVSISFAKTERIRARLGKMESEKAAAERANTRYADAIKQADQFFSGKQYEKARIAYENAARIKPEENYPKRKLDEIKDILEKQRTATAGTKTAGTPNAPTAQGAAGNKGNDAISNANTYAPPNTSVSRPTPEQEREAKQRADRRAADSINRALEESGRNWEMDMQRRQRESDRETALASRSFYTATAVSDAENNFKSNTKLANRYESVEELERDYQAKLNRLSESSNELANAKNRNLQANMNYAFRDADASGQAVGQLAAGIGSIINNISAEKQEQRAREKLAAERVAAQKKMEAEKRALLLSMRWKLVQDFPDGGTPLSSHRVGSNEVYLFAYWMDTTQLAQSAPVVRVTNVFPLGQRSDGTWPFKSSLSQDLTKLVPQSATMFGYFVSREKAMEWQEVFKRLATKSEMKVQELTFAGRPVKKGIESGFTERSSPATDFFGNSIQDSSKQQTTPAGKKQKVDFFGNPIKE